LIEERKVSKRKEKRVVGDVLGGSGGTDRGKRGRVRASEGGEEE
jgi:hypothetical protein